MKFADGLNIASAAKSRAPQGARGLKFLPVLLDDRLDLSRPARGAWVEIGMVNFERTFAPVAPRKGRVG